LEYIGADNQKHQPVMIHRAPFGSMERFVAVLIEHCAGNFPLWLAPEQVAILPISEKYHSYATSLYNKLSEQEITGFVDQRDEKIGRKIRDAEINKVPFMLIVGEKEQQGQLVSVRKHGSGDIGQMGWTEFIQLVHKEIATELGDN
jgi:threonyl-tRNA synthetase